MKFTRSPASAALVEKLGATAPTGSSARTGEAASAASAAAENTNFRINRYHLVLRQNWLAAPHPDHSACLRGQPGSMPISRRAWPQFRPVAWTAPVPYRV